MIKGNFVFEIPVNEKKILMGMKPCDIADTWNFVIETAPNAYDCIVGPDYLILL